MKYQGTTITVELRSLLGQDDLFSEQLLTFSSQAVRHNVEVEILRMSEKTGKKLLFSGRKSNGTRI
ncbi:hypothetical protein [Paenibacillus glycanilyticus]|uniref:hypothetical protein n=1 Tax=Paenibacillus glycanilyticus TaxID=126569 RepID=UPI003EB741F7